MTVSSRGPLLEGTALGREVAARLRARATCIWRLRVSELQSAPAQAPAGGHGPGKGGGCQAQGQGHLNIQDQGH